MINFDGIPSNLRVPLAYIEFNNSRAIKGLAAFNHVVMVFGQMLATGSAAADTPVRVLSADQAEELFGRGSMLAGMFKTFKQNNAYTETWCIPQLDDGAGVAATGSYLVGGAPTASGTLNLYIGGERIRTAVTSGDTAAQIAAAAVDAINADTSLPVTAAVNGVATEQIDISARHKGEIGNDIDLRVNYYDDEKLPTGLTCAPTAMSGGTGNPDVSTAIAALGDEWYHSILMPWTDSANLVLLETELDDRWGPLRQIDGIAYSAKRGSHATVGSFGDGRNSKVVSCIATGIAPQPAYLWAAAYCAQASASLAIDPARPLQTLPLIGIMPPSLTDRWSKPERNLLCFDGITPTYVDSGGVVRIEHAITMYQKNLFGIDDASYLNVNTPATLSRLRYSLLARITSKYPRHKLADDAPTPPPANTMTPKTMDGELIALAKLWVEEGWIENLEQFKADLRSERDSTDTDRLNVLVPPDLVNQFRIFAAQIQFRL